MNFVFIGVVFLSIGLVYGDTAEAWRQAALEKHNEYRKLHGAQPLTMNQELCEMSQKWAEHLKSKSGGPKLVHSTDRKDAGENLYWSMRGGSGSADAKIAPDIAVKSWYDEIKDYNFATGDSPNGGVIGHFTQVVWKGSKEVCVSYVKKVEGNSVEFFVVANYRPPGNWVGDYVPNVARPSGGGTAGLESRNTKNEGSRKESQQWHTFWWISLGFVFSLAMHP